MQRDNHRPIVHRSNTFKLVVRIIRSSRRQADICILISFNHKIYSKCSSIGGIFSGEYVAFVVYGYVVAFYCCPECLEVAVEKERIEAAWWGYFFAEVEQIDGSRIGAFRVEVNWGGVGVERSRRVA